MSGSLSLLEYEDDWIETGNKCFEEDRVSVSVSVRAKKKQSSCDRSRSHSHSVFCRGTDEISNFDLLKDLAEVVDFV